MIEANDTDLPEEDRLGHWNITELYRHSFATQVANACDEDGWIAAPAEDLANLMGHKNGGPGRGRK